MKSESNDVKSLAAKIVTFVTTSYDSALPLDTTKEFIPMLVNGSKEKNTVVKTQSESALVALLRIKQGDDNLQVSGDTRLCSCKNNPLKFPTLTQTNKSGVTYRRCRGRVSS